MNSNPLRAVLAALIVVLGSVSAVEAGGPVGASTSTHRITWLAAGDSYSSGQGLEYHSGSCARASGSSKTWAQVAQMSLDGQGLTFSVPDLVACTGAKEGEFFKSQGSNPAEWTKSMGAFDLVTFSFGGDDVGFRKILEECIALFCSDSHIRQRISQVGNSYPSFLKHVATGGSVVHGGNVVVIGYPELVEEPTLWPQGLGRCEYGIDVERARLIRGWAGDVNSDIGKAVATTNALPVSQRNGVTFTFIDPVSGNDGVSRSDPSLYEPATGTRHELCSQGSEWLNGLTLGLHPSLKKSLEALAIGALAPSTALFDQLAAAIAAQPYSFHPNQAGETAMGNLAAAIISHLTWPWSQPTGSGGSAAQTSMPVQVCLTTFGGGGQGKPQPTSISARTSLAGLPPMTAYTDSEGISEVIAPTGWGCSAFIGADSTTGISVWPPGASAPPQGSTVAEGIEAFVYPGANIGGQYDLVCGLFSSAVAQIGEAQGPCPASVPSAETDSTLKSDVVAFDDPPGVNGSWDNSSGAYSANGVMVYDYGGQVANTTSEQAACLLPASDKTICTASLNDFVDHYAHPVAGATNPPPTTTRPTTGISGNTGNSGGPPPVSNTGGTGNTG